MYEAEGEAKGLTRAAVGVARGLTSLVGVGVNEGAIVSVGITRVSVFWGILGEVKEKKRKEPPNPTIITIIVRVINIKGNLCPGGPGGATWDGISGISGGGGGFTVDGCPPRGGLKVEVGGL